MATTRRRGLTDKMLAAKKRKAKRYIEADPELRGHYVRIPPSGPIVFASVARNPYGKQIWTTIGTSSELNIAQARERARETIRRIKAGLPAIEPVKARPESVAMVMENWLARHVQKNKLRSAAEIQRIARKYILPYWADRTFTDIRRSDIAALLDVIEDQHGPAMADGVLRILRSIASWVQSRDDSYAPPFVRGMKRVPKEIHERSRILDDNELRQIWRAADEAGRYGDLVKLLLLTGQRLAKVLSIKWSDINDSGVWTIDTQAREKGNAGRLLLPQAALDTIRSQPRFVSNSYVFAGRGATGWKPSFRDKPLFDERCGVTGWRLHDLRRTARSLMSRAGVQSEHAERVLGHVIGGVEGVYDRHSYDGEKARALAELAALVERIVSPAPDVVVPLRERVS